MTDIVVVRRCYSDGTSGVHAWEEDTSTSPWVFMKEMFTDDPVRTEILAYYPNCTNAQYLQISLNRSKAYPTPVG